MLRCRVRCRARGALPTARLRAARTQDANLENASHIECLEEENAALRGDNAALRGELQRLRGLLPGAAAGLGAAGQ